MVSEAGSNGSVMFSIEIIRSGSEQSFFSIQVLNCLSRNAYASFLISSVSLCLPG
jgi:hypothetical protein